jgi:type I restriction enzyme M protein
VTVRQLAATRLLQPVLSRFATLDLDESAVPHRRMGQEYDELQRRFAAASPELFGEFTTPEDVSAVTVRLLLGPDSLALADTSGPLPVHNPCCGAGGLFSAVEEFLRDVASPAELVAAGQELNVQTYALARSARMMRGIGAGGIVRGDVLIDDAYRNQTFGYLLTAPPVGLYWKKQQEQVTREARELGFAGRFGAGLPRSTDSSLLFVQHVVAHMRPPAERGARAAVLLNAAPLFRGSAGSGESEIRRWLLEQDLLEGCPGCDMRELLLLTKVEKKAMTLRCGKDHEIVRAVDD